jgi:hypothetical protein
MPSTERNVGHRLFFSIAGTRALNAMGAVHNHCIHYLEHIRDIAEIHNQVVIAIFISPLRQPYLISPCIKSLFYGENAYLSPTGTVLF